MYAGNFYCIPSGRVKLRCLLLLWTGDYPAQCEVGKFIKDRLMSCRRDKLKGVYHMICHTNNVIFNVHSKLPLRLPVI